MMKSGVVDRSIAENSRGRYLFITAIFPLTALLVALLLGGALGTLDSSMSAIVVGAIIMVVVIALRQDELAVTLIVIAHLYVDWYLGLHIVALLLALLLLLTFFLARSSARPWVGPEAIWLWALFLVLPILPAIQGALSTYDAATYYPGNVLGAFMLYWLGAVIARNMVCVRRFFQIFAFFGALLAVHTIIQATTGIALFSSDRVSAVLASVSNYQLLGSNTSRASALFINPDWNGTFFALIIFLPLGLFIESSSFLKKSLYLVEMALILPALLFTYSNGAWLSAGVGVLAFVLFVGRTRYRIALPVLVLIAIAVMAFEFPAQFALQLQHAANPTEVSLRVGAWQTGIHVIHAFPWTGVGLGYDIYLLRAEPYRALGQSIPLAHPHNSYLEWGAMAGLPVLIVFLALLLFTLWRSWRNWLLVDTHTRSLLGGGIVAVITLSVNSLSINGWTLPPLAAMGWLILGVLSSPLLAKSITKA